MGIDLLVGKIETGVLNAALGLADTFPRLFGDAAENIKSNIKVVENGIAQSKDLLGKLFSDGYIKRDLEEAGKAFPESFKSAYDATQPLINVQEDMKEVNRLAEEINKTAAGLTWNMMSQVENLPQLTWNMKDHMKEGAGAMEKAAKTVKETLSMSEEIIKRIKESSSKDAIDKGGALEKAAGDAIAEGNFRKAERIADKIKGKEQDAAIREEFGGGTNVRKSVKDMAKEAGIDTSRKSNRELKDELEARIENRKKELPDGKRGKNEKEADGKGGANDPAASLQKTVEAIRVLVAKIEPKLPQTALAQ